jgi:EcsC protein family
MEKESKPASRLLHKALAAASGAVGGGFGLAALPVELPISTIIMLRSIGDIARSEGEDLADPESALACLQVFALGPRDGEANAAESGYFAACGLLAKSIAEAARFVAERGVVAEGAPVLVRFNAQIASRFGVVVTQKLAAQAVPVIGALGGAAVNYVFIDHFQEVARAHFVVRRLERRYGKDAVRAAYERFCSENSRKRGTLSEVAPYWAVRVPGPLVAAHTEMLGPSENSPWGRFPFRYGAQLNGTRGLNGTQRYSRQTPR